MSAPRPITVVALALMLVAGVTGCTSSPDPEPVTVAGVVDGSTVRVEQDGEPVTVRLLGIDTPAPDECLGADAEAALAELLPTGTEVRLEGAETGSDEVQAAVYVGDVLVDVELARLGLGHAVAGTAVAEEVAAAEADAVESGAGLFGTEAECTIPAQVAALESAGTEAVDGAAVLAAGVGLPEVEKRGAVVVAATTTAAALAALLDGDGSARYPKALVADLSARTAAVNERLGGAATAVQQVRASEEQRIEAERVAVEAAAAQAAADEAARVAQAAAEAESARVAAEAAAVAAAKAAQKPAPAPAPAPAAGGSAFYANCDAVRAAGAAPILAGQPGYSKKLDRDGDGIGCEN